MSNNNICEKKNDQNDAIEEESHLGWTAKQGYILTGGNKAESYYTAERGFPFIETDLPHYHILKGDTHSTFEEWKTTKPTCELVSGAWNRPLFVGGWKHSSDKEERVYNIQTHNLFIDLRIPRSREIVLKDIIERKCSSLDELSPNELRLYARQHVFSGYTVLGEENNRPVATRHHCIDWNFVGITRPRPNKWWIEVNDDVSCWKEYAYAKDDYGQHYYFERWERLSNGGSGGVSSSTAAAPSPRLAIRLSATKKRKVSEVNPSYQQDDGIFVLVGDHFNYIRSRKFTGNEMEYKDASSLVNLVDAAVGANDLDTARSYLSIDAGHGTISSGWKLDCAIPPWNEGKTITSSSMNGPMTVEEGSDSLECCKIVWKGEIWDIYDCSFATVEELKSFLS